MPADTDNKSSAPEAAAAGQNALGLGERLRSARKAKAMTIEQVAEAMHLEESIVTALEEERFESFGAAVYVRGHLKAYAQILDIPEASVLEAYHGENPETITAPALRRRSGTAITVNPMMWGIGTLAVALGLVLAIYVFQDDEIQTEVISSPAEDEPANGESSPVEPVPLSEPSGSSLSTDDVSRDAGPGEDEFTASPANRVAEALPDDRYEDQLTRDDASAAPTARVNDRVETQTVAGGARAEQLAESALTAPRPAATMRLTLRFSEESWVEISDARRRLLFGLQRQGRRRELTGEPPFNLLIGNAKGVELTVNDQPFDLPVSGRRGKVARFEITGDTLN